MTKDQNTDIIKEAQRAYKRQWRSQNKDKVQASNKRYWLKKAAEMGLISDRKEEKKNG